MKQAAGINYTETGEDRTGTPIICLHGIGGNSASFEPQLTSLSGHYRLISWNMPGYGDSAPIEAPTFPKLATKLCEFLDALHIDKAHLCGHSIGGMVAIETACLFPERVASLALMGTTAAFGGRDDSFKEKFIAARLKPLDAGMTLNDLALKFVPDITGPMASAESIAAAITSMAAIPQTTYRAIIHCLVTFNRRDDIARLMMPVCLIAGEHDTNAPAKTMARMAQKIPNAEYHEIKGAGHLINLEASAASNQILHSFYGKQS